MVSKTAVFFSFALHTLIAVVVLVTFDDTARKPRSSSDRQPKSVNAIMVQSDVLDAEVKRLQRVDDKEKNLKEKEIAKLKTQVENLQDKSRKERKAIKGLRSEKQRISEEKSQALKEKSLELRKAAEAQRLAEVESQRLIEARRLREEAELKKEKTEKEAAKAERRLAETELLEEMKSEEVSQEVALQNSRDEELIDKYAVAIKNRVLENFKILPGHEGLECTLRIRLFRGGHVAGIEVTKSSDNPSFDRLAETAVRKVAPMPVPEENRVFEKMRTISFVFRP